VVVAAAGEAGGESTNEGRKWTGMGDVEVNFRSDEFEETGVGGPCFLINFSRWSRACKSTDGAHFLRGGDEWTTVESHTLVDSREEKQIYQLGIIECNVPLMGFEDLLGE
jgi:hypothetical protein